MPRPREVVSGAGLRDAGADFAGRLPRRVRAADTPVTLETIRARLDWQPPTIEVQAEPTAPDRPAESTVAWLSGDPFAIALF